MLSYRKEFHLTGDVECRVSGVRNILGYRTPDKTSRNVTDHLKDFVIENPILIRDQIYDRIKQEILSGKISQGSRVLEGRLAKQINVSRTPVREALHILEMEGFLESFPRVGYRVRQVTYEEGMEIHEIRAVLEPLAARKAIENDDQDYLYALEQNLTQSEVAAREELDAFLLCDAEFDEIIVRASRMKTLLTVWGTLRQRLILYRIEAQHAIETRLKSIEGHRQILECLKFKDPEGAKKAIRNHLEDSKRALKYIRYTVDQ
jgi:GntR family transcriptional regulator, rspAB operon transcriptional repressor